MNQSITRVKLICEQEVPVDLYRFGFTPEKPDDEFCEATIKRCTEAISLLLEKQQRINMRSSSYTLKHKLERHIGSYVANGELIVAMLAAGFKSKPEAINAYFNVTEISIRTLGRSQSLGAEVGPSLCSVNRQ